MPLTAARQSIHLVDSLEQAHDLAAQDPMHTSGIRTATVEPWLQDLD